MTSAPFFILRPRPEEAKNGSLKPSLRSLHCSSSNMRWRSCCTVGASTRSNVWAQHWRICCGVSLAGVFTLENALALVAARGRLMQSLPAGTMLAVRLKEEEIKPFLSTEISLAAVNGASLCVLSGLLPAIDKLREDFWAKASSASRSTPRTLSIRA